MTSNGYIKLHRKLFNWEWYKDHNTLVVFLHLLLIANYGETTYQGMTIYPGQAVIGRKSLAKALGMSEQNVRTSLSHLKSTNEITIKSTNRFSVVTIENWAKYQLCDSEPTNEVTNETSANQPANQPHYKNIFKEEIKGGRPKGKGKSLEETYAMMEAWANDEN